MRKEKSGTSIRERLLYYSIPEPNTGCWLWTGATTGKKNNQYGVLRLGPKGYGAHRLSYEEFKEKIPEGLDLLHICDTPSCINPDHLRPGTHKDNMHDCMNKGRNLTMLKQSHCKRGHILSDDNVRVRFHRKRNQYYRLCKKCSNASALKAYHKNKDVLKWLMHPE